MSMSDNGFGVAPMRGRFDTASWARLSEPTDAEVDAIAECILGLIAARGEKAA